MSTNNETSAPVDVLAVGPGADFMAFAADESAALEPSVWERWVDRVEAALGFSLDGDDSEDARRAGTSDGYSLDGAYAAWSLGHSVERHVADVRASVAALAKFGGAA